MTKRAETKRAIRCAIYTRKSTEAGLEQEFNSLDAQRESGRGLHQEPGPRRLDLPARRVTTTAASPAAIWTALPCAACWPTSKPARSIA